MPVIPLDAFEVERHKAAFLAHEAESIAATGYGSPDHDKMVAIFADWENKLGGPIGEIVVTGHRADALTSTLTDWGNLDLPQLQALPLYQDYGQTSVSAYEPGLGDWGGPLYAYSWRANEALSMRDEALDHFRQVEVSGFGLEVSTSGLKHLALGALGMVGGYISYAATPFTGTADVMSSASKGRGLDPSASDRAMTDYVGKVGMVAEGAGIWNIGRLSAAGNAAAIEARGGAYLLRDPANGGAVVRSGRTINLAQREAQHLRDPALKDFDFDPVYRTDVYNEQRGLEQILHDAYQPPLNKIRPISLNNKNYDTYMEAARGYLGN